MVKIMTNNTYIVRYKINKLIKPSAVLKMQATNVDINSSNTYLRERIADYNKYSLNDLLLSISHLCINKYITSIYPPANENEEVEVFGVYAICVVDMNGVCHIQLSSMMRDVVINIMCDMIDKYNVSADDAQCRLIGYYHKEAINKVMKNKLYTSSIELNDNEFIISPHKTIIDCYDDAYKCIITPDK